MSNVSSLNRTLLVSLGLSIQSADIVMSRIEELEKDERRLGWLINHSALNDSEEKDIQLAVTERAVAICNGTHLPEYHAAVRVAIDERMATV